jgi:hypothetical protein
MIMKMIKDDEEGKQKARRKTGFLEENRFICKETPDLKGNSWGSARFGCVSPVVDLGACSFSG